MSERDVLYVACGTWGSAVLDTVASHHPATARRARRLDLAAVETETPSSTSADRLTLVVPSAAAFRQRILTEVEPKRLGEILPASWSQDLRPHATLAQSLDDRHRFRLAVLAAEPRVKRRVAALVSATTDIVLIGAPDEPLAAASLVAVGRWAREAVAAVAGDARAAAVDLVIGLDPVGEKAAREPDRAARLHATLCEIDRARSAADPASAALRDPFARVIVLANAALTRDDLAAAAAEVLGWWPHCASPASSADAVAGARPVRRFRGRVVAYHGAVAASAVLDVGNLVADQASAIAGKIARTLTHGAGEAPSRDLGRDVERIVTDVRSALQLPSDERIRRFPQDVAAPEEAGLHVASRSERIAERMSAQAEAARQAGRTLLLGGSIQRMSGTVATGYLDQQVDWLWQVVLRGHAGLDDVVRCLNRVALALNISALDAVRDEQTRALTQLAQKVDRFRKEQAPPRMVAQAQAEALRGQAVIARCEVAMDVLAEVRAAIGGIVQALLAAKESVARLQKVVAASARPLVSSPWRVAIPVPAEGASRAILGDQGGERAWLASLAAGAAGDPTRGLGRAPDVLADHLLTWLAGRVDEFVKVHPVAALNGIGPWLAGVIADAVPPSDVDPLALPASLEPRTESFLLAGATEPAPLAAALPSPPTLLPAGDPSRLGYLALTGPLPLAAFAGLRQAKVALEQSFAASRLMPLSCELASSAPSEARFHDPIGEDLIGRLRRDIPRRGLALPDGIFRGLESTRWDDARPAMMRLASLPAVAPALRQAATLAQWCALSDITALAGIDRAAQELSSHGEADGADVELLEACAAMAEIATPVKKTLEAGPAATKVTYLTQAQAAAAAARAQVEGQLVGPERLILLGLLATWTGWIEQALAGLRGRSDLVVRLRTRRLVVAGQARVLVEVENRGEHPALVARLELLASPLYRVIGEAVRDLPQLGPGDRRVVEFVLKPQRAGATPIELALTWSDLEAADKRARCEDVVELIDQPPPFRRIERNPYIAGPPVRTPEMFFGRNDVFEYIRDGLAGRYQDNILILHGQRRTGKSSILCQLERRDLLPEHLPVLIDLQGLGGFDTAGLLYQLARHASRRLARRVQDGSAGGGAAPPLPERERFERGPYDAFQEHLDVLEDALEGSGKRILFMIDEFDVLEGRVESGSVEPEVFPFLRNLMQHRERLAFLLAGTQQLVEMRHDYWSILFSLASYRKVSYLSPADARALVEEPLKGEVIFDDLVIDSLLHLTAGHPYYLQLTCQNIVQRMNHGATHAFVTPEDLQAVLPEVLAAGGGHFQHEWRVLGSSLARCALAAMAERDDTGLRWFGADEVAAMIATDASGAGGARETEQALDQLVHRDVAEASASRGAWRIRIDLLRHWVRRNHPLARTVAEHASGSISGGMR